MRVIATASGFYKGARIRSGQAFEVPEGTKGKWFVPAAPVEKPKAEAKPAKVGKTEAKPPADDLT
jgi:hypothetical protein